MLKFCRCISLSLLIVLFSTFAVNAQTSLIGNLNEDHCVDHNDLFWFIEQWLDTGGCSEPNCADLYIDDLVNFKDFGIFAGNWQKCVGSVVINEIMASNDETLADEDGDYTDWIEFLNISETSVDLDGWFLKDENNRWQFPSGISLESGDTLVIFASAKNRNSDPNYLHTNFELNRDGDYLALVQSDGITVEYEVGTFTDQRMDVSLGLQGQKTPLISSPNSVKYLVPSGSIGTDWQGGSEPFNDSAWTSAPTPVGYSTLMDPNLQVYYAFEGSSPSTVTDSSNYGRDGSISGANRTSNGRIGKALDFDGNNDSVSINVPGNMQQMTLSMWVNFDFVSEPNPPEGTVVSPLSHVGEETGAFYFIINSWGYLRFTALGESDECELVSSDTISLDTWHHIVITYDNINHLGQIYFDGRLEGFTENTAGQVLVGNSTIAAHDGDDFCDAQFDEVAIWNRILDKDEINKLATGVSAGNIYLYDDLINTDIEGQMQSNNASVYTRCAFNVTDLNDIKYLTLKMQYDDGFAAFLNGTEIASRNAPSSILWNSAAASSRPNSDCMNLENINLTPYIDLLDIGTNILAIQGLNIDASDEDFLLSPQLYGYTLSTDTNRYFTEPSPGELNDEGYIDLVADTTFSHDRGYYNSAFDVTINTETDGATIRYTLDGSEPNETHGSIYTSPININTTSYLRAMAYKNGYLPTNVDTQTYIFASNVATQPTNPPGMPATWKDSFPADYQVDPDVVGSTLPGYSFEDALLSIPTISIVTDHNHLWSEQTGIYYNDSPENEWAVKEQNNRLWERPTSVEIIYPDSNEGYQINCGIRMHGAITRSHSYTPKHSMRLFFRGDYGNKKLNFPLFGDSDVDRFDQIVLRSCSRSYAKGSDGATYHKDQWMRDTLADMGQPGSHGIYAHLYLNGLYWGLYNPCERLHDSFWAEHLDGDKDEYDVLKDWVELHSGSMDSWNEMIDLASDGLETSEKYQRIQGNNTNGSRNPDYPVYLDVDNLIDYMIVHIHADAVDWPGHNWWTGRRRGLESTGYMFSVWDQEGVLESLDPYGRETVDDMGPAFLYDKLRQNAHFRMRFTDRLHKHVFNGGALSITENQWRWNQRINEMDKAIVGESARWGDTETHPPLTREDNWLDAVNWINNTYFPNVDSPALQRFKNVDLYPDTAAPTFYINSVYQHGGYITPGASLTMIAPAGTIYYTIDGNDPYLFPVGLDSATLVPEDSVKAVLIPTVSYPSGADWRTNPGFDDSSWTDYTYTSGKTGGVGYERSSGYQDHISYDVESQMYNSDTSCYIRIPFTVTAQNLIDFDEMTLKIRYDDGFVAYINGTEVKRANFTGTPQWDSSADNADRESSSFAVFDISSHMGVLSVGSNILAIHGLNAETNSSDFLISPELVLETTIGGGVSSSAVEYSGAIILNETTHVKARALDAGEWSALNEAVYPTESVKNSLRITEIMYHPVDVNDPNAEFIELVNIGAGTINLNQVRFNDGVGFTFGSIQLDPHKYIVVVYNTEAFEAEYGSGINIAGQYSGRLNNAGENVRLIDANNVIIHEFDYEDDWYPITDGQGFSLNFIDANDPNMEHWDRKQYWQPSSAIGGTPSADDSGAVYSPDDIVINELLAHSHGSNPDWTELHNTTGQTINIGGWFLSDDPLNLKKYEITPGTSIMSGGYTLFYEDVTFGNPGDPGCNTPFALSENGETLYLSSGLNGELTGYSEEEEFGPSATNVTFGRYVTSTGRIDFVSMAAPTAGNTNSDPKVGPIVITEIMYHPLGNGDAEFVELYNKTAATVYLFDGEGNPWKFTDDGGIDYLFPADANILAYSYAVLVKDQAAFNSEGYSAVPGSVQVFQWGDGKLNNAGEDIIIAMPGDLDGGIRQYITIDHIEYSDDHPWPIEPDTTGDSLNRNSNSDYGNDVVNWSTGTPSPGS
ncbi:MAG: lamin tail domain-containing protein [Planctomycetota bacterium]|jgi:hypothetical protein